MPACFSQQVTPRDDISDNNKGATWTYKVLVTPGLGPSNTTAIVGNSSSLAALFLASVELDRGAVLASTLLSELSAPRGAKPENSRIISTKKVSSFLEDC
jgi:hypothetical protein